jgi:hypothetical protein
MLVNFADAEPAQVLVPTLFQMRLQLMETREFVEVAEFVTPRWIQSIDG